MTSNRRVRRVPPTCCWALSIALLIAFVTQAVAQVPPAPAAPEMPSRLGAPRPMTSRPIASSAAASTREGWTSHARWPARVNPSTPVQPFSVGPPAHPIGALKGTRGPGQVAKGGSPGNGRLGMQPASNFGNVRGTPAALPSAYSTLGVGSVGRDQGSAFAKPLRLPPTARAATPVSPSIPAPSGGPTAQSAFAPSAGMLGERISQHLPADAANFPRIASRGAGMRGPFHAVPPEAVKAKSPHKPLEALPTDFAPTPLPPGSEPFNPVDQALVYDDRYDVPTQRPWLELGIPFYASGIMPRGGTLLGKTNLMHPAVYMYGDYRVGVAAGRNAIGRIDNGAHRLNLDTDIRLTATERFHTFIGPFNRATQFSTARFVDGRVEFDPNFNLNPVTAFFEGDGGAILGGLRDQPSPFEFPFTVGLVPLLFQNGIWMEDAVAGGAFAIPGRHSAALDWSNYDLTFFAIADQIISPAFAGDPNAAQAVGSAIFLEAYNGYIEAGYAYLHDRYDLGRSYHNMTFSYTRRYLDWLSNSLRVIINAGQELPRDQRTADGGLLLIENSFVSRNPLFVTPYMNFFYGWRRPQSVARAGVSGGILRNVGINFDPDGLNGHPTLDPTANDTFGGTIGIDLLGKDLARQLILEVAYVGVHGSDVGRLSRDDQIGLAGRYQFPISHATLLRFDAMYGIRRSDVDIYGTRMEFRWKF